MKRTRQAMRERDDIILEIRKAIAEKDMTEAAVGKELGMGTDTFAKRLNGIYEFKLIEIIVLADLLGIEIII